MNKLKKIIYANIAFVFVFGTIILNSNAHAATRLAPIHLYKWAAKGDLQNLQRYRRYINLEDYNHNTALCLAQKAQNKDAYTLLLKFGASTKVSCHNDNDPICALVAGDKYKISPAAGWLLLGAGAAAGIYALLDDDDKNPPFMCPTGYQMNLKDCSGEAHPEGYDYERAEHTGGYICGRCVPHECRRGSEEYEHTDNCPIIDHLTASATNVVDYHGNTPCYECEYQCDETTAWARESNCKSGGYTCTLQTFDGVQCYIRTGSESCSTAGTDYQLEVCQDGEDYTATIIDRKQVGFNTCYLCGYQCRAPEWEEGPGYTTGFTGTSFTLPSPTSTPCYKDTACATNYQSEACATSEGVDTTTGTDQTSTTTTLKCHTCSYACKTNWNDGTAPSTDVFTTTQVTTPKQCYGYIACKSPYIQGTSATACGAGGEQGWDWTTAGTQTTTSGTSITCGLCTEHPTCSAGDENLDTIAKCNAATHDNHLTAADTNVVGYKGNTPCYQCTYACNESNAWASESSCTTGGYTCTRQTFDGVQCYVRTGSESCSTAGTDYQDTVCTGGTNYTATTVDTKVVGFTTCYLCAYQCKAPEWEAGSGYTTGFTGTSFTLPSPTSTPCYKDTACATGYQSTACATSAGVDTTTGTDQTSTTTTLKCHTCSYACKTNWTAGTAPSTDVFTTTQVTTPKQCYGYIACKSPYIQGTSAAACGAGGSQGWDWTTAGTQTTTSGTAITCGLCTEHPTCSAGDANLDTIAKCNAATHDTHLTAADTNVVGYKGNTPCYQCTYACNESNAWARESSCTAGGYTCTRQTFDGIQCYVRTGSESCSTAGTDYQDTACTSGTNYTTTTVDTKIVGSTTCYLCAYQCKAPEWEAGSGYTTGFTGTSFTLPYPTSTPCYKDTACATGYQSAACATSAGVDTTTGTDQTSTTTTLKCHTCSYACKTNWTAGTAPSTDVFTTTQVTTPKQCYGYLACKSPYVQGTSAAACGAGGSQGWDWSLVDTKTSTSGTSISCGTCTEHSACSAGDANLDTIAKCNAATHDSHLTAADTNVVGYKGNTPCYQCTYACNESNAWARESSCTAGGYTCSRQTFDGVQCYVRTGSEDCPSDYPYTSCTSTDTTKYTASIAGQTEVGGRTCYKCSFACATSWASGTGYSTGFTGTSFTTPVQCYKDTACNTSSGYQSAACSTATGITTTTGTDQTSTTTTLKCHTCSYACATNWTSGTLNTTYYTTTSSTIGSLTCRGYTGCNGPTYIQGTSAVACGAGGEQGWTWATVGTVTTTAGTSITCGTCTPRSACYPKGDTNLDTIDKCNAATHDSHLTAADTNPVGYKGNTPCYECSYQCNETTAFRRSSTCTSGGYSCSLQTFDGVQCYVRNGSGAAITSQNLTNTNTETIALTSTGNENITALSDSNNIVNMVDEETGEAGRIVITHNATGTATGIHGEGTNGVYNREGASIEIANNNGGRAVGIHVAEGGSAVNEGNITITGDTATGTAIGIYGEGQNTIVNGETGVIDVTSGNAYGIYVNNGTDTTIQNKGIIRANGENAHGIYVNENGAKANVYNTGSIYLNGTEAGNAGITLNGGELRNASLVNFNGSADLNQVNASFFLEDGGIYEAESLSGDLYVGTSNVLGSNLDTYTNEGINADNVDDLNVLSESALFTASLQPAQAGHPTAVTLNRQSFAVVSPNASVADYLETNYTNGNLTEMYDKIKEESSISGASRQTADQLGYDMLPNFAEENFTVLKSLNRNMADQILTPTRELNRVVVGADYINTETKHKSYLAGYELNATSAYMFGDKRLDNRNRLGLGIDFTNINTDYDHISGDRKLNMVTVFMPYLHKFTDRLRLASILSFGYGDGEYDRGANRESDITDIFYGFTNELRYTINMNGFAELEPALMLNAIGYTEDGFEEDQGSTALISKKTHNNSVEAGVGLFLKKKVALSKFSRLGFKIGGAYYRELADPYDDLTLRHRGGAGWYKVNDYAHIYDDDRALLEAAIDFDYKRFSIYAKYNQLIQRDNPSMIDVGLKYNF